MPCTYLYEVFHGLGVVRISISIVLPSLQRNRSSRLYEPTRERSAAKLSCFCSKSKHVPSLQSGENYLSDG